MKPIPKQTEKKNSKPSKATAPASEVKLNTAAPSPAKPNAPPVTTTPARPAVAATPTPTKVERAAAPVPTPAPAAPPKPSPAPAPRPAAPAPASASAQTPSPSPTPSKRNAKFVLFAPEAKQVAVSGDFNAWSPHAAPMRRQQNGQWETALVLQPGRYQYKFVADGQWLHDPQAAEVVPNDQGTLNSVIEVRP